MKQNFKFLLKIIFTINLFLFSSCTTLDLLSEKMSSLGEKFSKTESDINENQKKTKKSLFTYTAAKDYTKAYSFRNDMPVPISKKIPSDIKKLKTTNPSEYVKQCCQFINQNSQDDFEKVKIAHDIVALNTKYDAKSFWAGTIPSQDYETVLKSGYAVCEGYSNLLKKFLDTLKFKNVKISGYARGVGTSLLSENSVASNHAWNMVEIQGEYYFIDNTWDSGYMNGKNSVQRYTTDWLFIKPEHFIYTHFPSQKYYQLLENPLSSSEFLNLPDFRPKLFEIAENLKIKNDSENPTQNDILKTNFVQNSIQLEYKLKNDSYLGFSIIQTETNSRKENLCFSQNDGEKTLTTIQFPKKGSYQIQIFYYKKDAKQGWSCGEFYVQSESASSILYPQVYKNSFNAEILSPIEMPLKKGKIYHFEVNCQRKFVVIIVGKDFVQMKKSENGNFVLDYEIPSNAKELNIGAANSLRGSYQTIAVYDCK